MSDQTKVRILVVDQDGGTRNVLRQILGREAGWEVAEAQDGSDALRQLRAEPGFDVCITELQLPEMDGLALLKAMRADPNLKPPHVIVCTGVRDREIIARVAALSISYYMLKPVKPDLVLTQVRQAVGLRSEGVKRRPAPVVKGDLGAFLRRVPNPPSLPAIYQALMTALERPDRSITELSQIVLKDPGLTSRLLKLANSAFFGVGSSVTTVEAAAQLIGLAQLRDLALATSIITSFDGMPAALVDVDSFWEHSLGCAVASVVLAEHCNHPCPERLFVGGLLHDLGRLLMFLGAPDETRAILVQCERQQALATKVEREMLGFDHADLGGEFLAHWGLPKSLIEMVRRHHLPPKPTEGGQDIAIIHLADFIASALPLGNSGERYLEPPVHPEQPAIAALLTCPIDMVLAELDQRWRSLLPAVLKRNGGEPGRSSEAAAPGENRTFPPAILSAAEQQINERFTFVPINHPILETLRQQAVRRAAAKIALIAPPLNAPLPTLEKAVEAVVPGLAGPVGVRS